MVISIVSLTILSTNKLIRLRYGMFYLMLISRVLLNFQYFTNITDIPPFAFYRFKKLKSICLPPSIKTIGHRAFYGCTSLLNIESDAPIENVLKIKL